MPVTVVTEIPQPVGSSGITWQSFSGKIKSKMNLELPLPATRGGQCQVLPSHQMVLLPSESPVTATGSWLWSTAHAELSLNTDTEMTSLWRHWDTEQKEMSCSKAVHWTKPFSSPQRMTYILMYAILGKPVEEFLPCPQRGSQ